MKLDSRMWCLNTHIYRTSSAAAWCIINPRVEIGFLPFGDLTKKSEENRKKISKKYIVFEALV